MNKQDEGWLCGFWEGDGSIGFSSKTPTVSFHQKDTRILYYIKDLLQWPRDIRRQTTKDPELLATRVYEVIICGNDFAGPLIRLLASYVVCQNRAKQLTKALKKLPRRGCKKYRAELHKPSLPWIVGLFDAEGSFSPASRITPGVSVGQHNIECLEEVRQVIGGRISKNGWGLNLRKDEAWRFLPTYIEYSRNPQKLERLYSVLYWMQEQPTPKSKRGRKPKLLPEGITLDGIMKDLKTKLGRWNE